MGRLATPATTDRSPSPTPGARTLYTIGHSNHPADGFLALLELHGIQVVVDVRSSPYSRRVPQANREILSRTLESAGITYQWLGARLGGKPGGAVADHDALRRSPSFQAGLVGLLELAPDRRAAVMCAEGDHRQCHRGTLITPELLAREVRVLHIRPDGSIVDADREPKQLALF